MNDRVWRLSEYIQIYTKWAGFHLENVSREGGQRSTLKMLGLTIYRLLHT